MYSIFSRNYPLTTDSDTFLGYSHSTARLESNEELNVDMFVKEPTGFEPGILTSTGYHSQHSAMTKDKDIPRSVCNCICRIQIHLLRPRYTHPLSHDFAFECFCF